MIDDGSLAFLDIKPDPNSVRYNCKETSQQKLVNKRFTVLGFTMVKTKFSKNGADRCLVHIKTDPDDDDFHGEELKFFTNSRDIKYVLAKIEEMDKFPRKVKMNVQGNNYWFT